jgi:hypothetical protein
MARAKINKWHDNVQRPLLALTPDDEAAQEIKNLDKGAN